MNRQPSQSEEKLMVCSRWGLYEETLAIGFEYGYNYSIYKKTQKGRNMKKMIFAVAAALSMTQLHAELDGHFQLSVFSPGELPASSYTIRGARISLLYGQCEEFYGLDVGVAGTVRGYMYGIQSGVLFNDVGADAYGLQVSCVNYVKGSFTGAQLGLANFGDGVCGFQSGLLNHADADAIGLNIGLMNFSERFIGCEVALGNVANGDAYGLQCGVYNHASGDMFGCQIGLGNVATGNANGFQCGVYNHASGCARGLQLGVMNWSEDLAGCQIGLANIVTSRSWSVWPIINIGW